MAFDDESTVDLESQEILVDKHARLLLTPEQELRMRCVEAVALSVSGAQYPIQSATVLKNMADEIERYVRGG